MREGTTGPSTGLETGKLVAERAPAHHVPQFTGPVFQVDGLDIELRHSTAFEVYFRAPQDVITFTIDALPSMAVAYNSDRISRADIQPARMHFHPAESDVYSQKTNPERCLGLVMAIDPAVRHAIEAELAGPASELRTEINIGTPLAVTLCHTLAQFMQNGSMGGRLVADSIATLAMGEAIQALRGRKSAQEERQHTRIGSRMLSRVIDYIEAHLHEDMRISDLASAACLSRYHFSRAFKASTGRTPIEYVLERRLRRAEHLLRETDESLAAVAFNSGFSSQSHMTSAFRKQLGVTPGQIRGSQTRGGRIPWDRMS